MITGVSLLLPWGEQIDLPAPNRHPDLLHEYFVNNGKKVPPGTAQGFHNEKYHFLTREKAREHALKCGQITTTQHAKKLFSEDLW